MLGVYRFTQVRDGIRSSLLRQRSKIRDAAALAKESKIRWAGHGHVMRFNDNRWTRAASNWAPPGTGRPPTGWSDFFTKSFKEKYDAFRVKEGTTGLLWHVIGTNERITGARSTINGSQGEQGDQVQNSSTKIIFLPIILEILD
ncbi:hypothetical protein RB195_010144 [Necator americanus]|uniref:Uncharacterized protein n=1 Tax=Necator americanus TaxID=51031 RepID=A0ABR1CYI3_NECAM